MENNSTQHSTFNFKEAFKTPPRDFFDLRKSSLPPSYEIAKARVEANLIRFKAYYVSLSLFFLLVFFLLRPSFGFFLGIVSLSYYLHQTLPTVKGYKTSPLVVNIGTGVSLFICALIFSHTLVSILALMSLVTMVILSHAVSLNEGEEGVDVGV